MEETDRRANLLEVVNRVHQKISVSAENPAEGGESPIDYSLMNKKRRLLQMSPKSGSNKAFDYGSDGHSDDRSSSGSPDDSNNYSGLHLASSPDMERLEEEDHLDHSIHRHPRLQDMQPSQQPNAAALHLFLQAQHQQQQHPELINPFLRLSAMSQQGLRWPEQPSPPPPQPTIALPQTHSGPTSAATLELARATHESQKKFAEFRETLLRQIQTSRSSSSSSSGKIRTTPTGDAASDAPCDDKDNAYWERRRKNNEAAKRSRDARRAKEQEIALRAQFLEQENISMKLEIAHLKAENAQLRGQFQHHLKLKL